MGHIRRLRSKHLVAAAFWAFLAYNFARLKKSLGEAQPRLVDGGSPIDTPPAAKSAPPRPKFFILAPRQVTTNLLQNHSKFASDYYDKALNEESAELWLYRGAEKLSYDEGHTKNVIEADYFLLPGLLHLYAHWVSTKNGGEQGRAFIRAYKKKIVDPSKPHLLLVPTWNLQVARTIGLKALADDLKEMGVNLWSVGFERNHMWQHVSVDRIVPIPYVVRPSNSTSRRNEPVETSKVSNSVFYVGSKRRNAKNWAGCHRDRMIEPLQNETNMNVRLVGKHDRMSQLEYNHLMSSSEYCLVLCGDTPSSRSLTSAMVAGCIPLRVGSRLRGLCEPPCKTGYGWVPTGAEYPHLPYPETIQWEQFPEVNEDQFMASGKDVLAELFQRYDETSKTNLRIAMKTTRDAWIYGWGDPVDSQEFGHATTHILNSFVAMFQARL